MKDLMVEIDDEKTVNKLGHIVRKISDKIKENKMTTQEMKDVMIAARNLFINSGYEFEETEIQDPNNTIENLDAEETEGQFVYLYGRVKHPRPIGSIGG